MKILFLLIILWNIAACTDERIPIPKPRMYPKVDFPSRQYVHFDQNYCVFDFEYPDYMLFKQDTTLINQKAKHPCWFTLDIPSLNGSVHFTYTDISGANHREKLLDVIIDSRSLTDKHNLKAAGRRTNFIKTAQENISVITYSVEGDVASPYHFVVTDSLNHAVWGSLYFYSKPNEDSMAPVINFVKEDLNKIIHSFKWTSKED
jgi:gliding motility-associated lipoprotein GldD